VDRFTPNQDQKMITDPLYTYHRIYFTSKMLLLW